MLDWLSHSISISRKPKTQKSRARLWGRKHMPLQESYPHGTIQVSYRTKTLWIQGKAEQVIVYLRKPEYCLYCLISKIPKFINMWTHACRYECIHVLHPRQQVTHLSLWRKSYPCTSMLLSWLNFYNRFRNNYHFVLLLGSCIWRKFRLLKGMHFPIGCLSQKWQLEASRGQYHTEYKLQCPTFKSVYASS